MRTLIVVLCVLTLSGCASMSKRPPAPTIEEIVQMSKDKVAPQEIIQRMKDSHAVYRLSGSEFANLKANGVADVVLDYMQDTLIAAERFDEYLNARDRYLFYGWPGYGPYWAPYPYRPYAPWGY